MTTRIPPPGPHGDDASRIAAALGSDPADLLDLAQSMNPFAPPAAHVVAAHLGALASYPDTGRAETALAEAMGVERELVLLTNGGAEAIALVAADCRTGYVEQPEFSLYARHLERLDPSAGRWRSNPGNPSGRLCDPEEHAAVWDEAFFPLSTGTWTRGDHRRGSAVVGSLTKLLACPGLRIGYVIAPDPAMRDRLAGRQPRWSVNGLAAAALPELLAPVDLQAWSTDIAKLRGELVEVLLSHGLSVLPSDAPYVLVNSAVDLRQRLAHERVVVRDCASFGLSGSFRIAVPDGAGLERIDRALGPALDRAPDGAPPPPRTRLRAGGADRASTGAGGNGDGTALRGALMVCGTSSDAGKSQIVAGICRALSRRGVSVAPFKGQNMSLNSFVTPAGHEIGRAQAMQAMAARATPEVAMNPVLLKPTGERRSQVVVMGRPVGELDSREYQHAKRGLRPVVLAALSDLRARYEVVILEGAGSPAEINLLDGDLVNLGLAAEAAIPAIIVGDIERGGVFASLYGTVALLPERLRLCLRGFAVNKLRGDASLLDTGIAELQRRTGLRSLGVIPWVEGLSLDAEDSLALGRSTAAWGPAGTGAAGCPQPVAAPGGGIDVAVIRLPRIANFTDLDALAVEPAVAVRFVSSPAQLGSPDLILVPGSKTTVADLAWLRESGLASALAAAVEAPGGPVLLGVCAGYQMLGEWIDDVVESTAGRVPGLGMLAVQTRFEEDKVTLPRRGSALGTVVTGYEIRHGRPVVGDGSGWIALDRVPAEGAAPEGDGEELEGASGDGGRVLGTSLHGLFESDSFRSEFLRAVAARAGKAFWPSGVSFAGAREAQFERVADLVEQYLDVESLWQIIAGRSRAGVSP